MNMKETLSTLLPGVEISEEFVSKLTASFETAIAKRIEEETKELNDKVIAIQNECEEKIVSIEEEAQAQIKEINDKANAYAEYVVEEMSQKVDDYCDYVIEKFIEEQKSQLVDSIEYSRMANTLKSIQEAFEVNYFKLSEEPANKDIEQKLQESKLAYNELFEEHRTLRRNIEEYSIYVDEMNRKAIFEEQTKNLADTQKEKIERLIEKANFSTIEEFSEGVQYMIEEIINPNNSSNEPKLIPEEKVIPTPNTNNSSDRMKAYLEVL